MISRFAGTSEMLPWRSCSCSLSHLPGSIYPWNILYVWTPNYKNSSLRIHYGIKDFVQDIGHFTNHFEFGSHIQSNNPVNWNLNLETQALTGIRKNPWTVNHFPNSLCHQMWVFKSRPPTTINVRFKWELYIHFKTNGQWVERSQMLLSDLPFHILHTQETRDNCSKLPSTNEESQLR